MWEQINGKNIRLELLSDQVRISKLIVFVCWIVGIVLAKGWLKVVAILVPFYAWYLVLELAMIYFGWI